MKLQQVGNENGGTQDQGSGLWLRDPWLSWLPFTLVPLTPLPAEWLPEALADCCFSVPDSATGFQVLP